MYYYPQQQNQYAAAAYTQPQFQVSGLKGRPVSSLDEARAAQIDFDGSVFIFPDFANKCIYTKQISTSGIAIFNKYTIQEEVCPTTPAYITKEELDKALVELKNEIAAAAQDTPTQTQDLKAAPPHIF